MAAFWERTTSVADVACDSDPLFAVTLGVYVAAFGCPPPMVNVAATPCDPAGTLTVAEAPTVVDPPTVQLADVPLEGSPR